MKGQDGIWVVEGLRFNFVRVFAHSVSDTLRLFFIGFSEQDERCLIMHKLSTF